MLPSQRREFILREVEVNGGAKVTDLSEALGVSQMTVRRDIDALARSGRVRKVHGGASAPTEGMEPTFLSKAGMKRAEKRAIARAAVEHIGTGRTVGLTGGTTTYMVAEELLKVPSLTVVTNSIPVAEMLQRSDRSDMTVLLTGGVASPTNALVGPFSRAVLEQVRIDTLFMGVHGMDSEVGYSTPNHLEAMTNGAFIESARKVVVCADHSKWGLVGISPIAPLDAADVLITDANLSEDARTHLEASVSEVIAVDPSDDLEAEVASL